MPSLPRVLGALTAAYGAGVLVRPALLAGPCELTDERGATPAGIASLARAVGARDLVSGIAMVTAPRVRPCAGRSGPGRPATRRTRCCSG
ncbi:hypothetical protein [Saccharopolyspora sp. CA-218241]|uniref:hypothetical protein n=1 Tax=Saccharopolyspora sp. CA-218241 TaxID=3240027 RepID=UPI003D995C2E